MKTDRKKGVFTAIRMAAASHPLLTAGTLLCVAASVAASLLPPLLLARVIDKLTVGLPLTFWAVRPTSAALHWRAGSPRRRKVCWSSSARK